MKEKGLIARCPRCGMWWVEDKETCHHFVKEIGIMDARGRYPEKLVKDKSAEVIHVANPGNEDENHYAVVFSQDGELKER